MKVRDIQSVVRDLDPDMEVVGLSDNEQDHYVPYSNVLRVEEQGQFKDKQPWGPLGTAIAWIPLHHPNRIWRDDGFLIKENLERKRTVLVVDQRAVCDLSAGSDYDEKKAKEC